MGAYDSMPLSDQDGAKKEDIERFDVFDNFDFNDNNPEAFIEREIIRHNKKKQINQKM